MGVKLIHVQRTTPLCWLIMPELERRVRTFCAEIAVDTNPDNLWSDAMVCFAASRPEVRLMAAIDEDLQVRGHFLFTLSDWYGTRFVNLLQYQLDEALPIELLRAGFETVKAFGRRHGAKEIRCIAESPERARAFRTFYGFTGNRVLMSMSLTPGADAQGVSDGAE